MLRLLADENFNNDIVRGVLRRNPGLDLVRVQDTGLGETDDPLILEWAARETRQVLTHDSNTMPGFAKNRIEAGQPMAGLFVVGQHASLSAVIEDILLVAEYSDPSEWAQRIVYLPLS
jgi:predicted nuclease of predicted toxin-antitoxin system